MDDGGPAAPRYLRPADQLDAVGLQAAHQWVQPVDVDREVMKSLAAAGEETLDEARRARALDQLHLAAREPEPLEGVCAVPAALLRPRRLDREEAPEPAERRVDRAHRERHVIDAEAHAVARRDRVGRVIRGRRAVEARHLPELDQDARRGARRDEGGLVAVAVVAAVDDAEARALEGRGVGAEPALLDIDREMMHALAAAGEETLDEARRARALDQLELPVADEEVGPHELVIVAGTRLDTHADGEPAGEEGAHRRASHRAAVHEAIEACVEGRRVADHEAPGRVRHRRVAALEDGPQLVLLELGRRVHGGDVRATAAEDAEVTEPPPLAVE